MESGVIALLSAVFGGIGVKLAEGFLFNKNRKLDEASAIRLELREEVKSMRALIKELSDDLDAWKNKYYNLLDEHNALRAEYSELKEKHEGLEKEVVRLRAEVATKRDN